MAEYSDRDNLLSDFRIFARGRIDGLNEDSRISCVCVCVCVCVCEHVVKKSTILSDSMSNMFDHTSYLRTYEIFSYVYCCIPDFINYACE